MLAPEILGSSSKTRVISFLTLALFSPGLVLTFRATASTAANLEICFYRQIPQLRQRAGQSPSIECCFPLQVTRLLGNRKCEHASIKSPIGKFLV
ncbi:hypothetical protein V8F06_013283, partial [Rhypophila decipiens]